MQFPNKSEIPLLSLPTQHQFLYWWNNKNNTAEIAKNKSNVQDILFTQQLKNKLLESISKSWNYVKEFAYIINNLNYYFWIDDLKININIAESYDLDQKSFFSQVAMFFAQNIEKTQIWNNIKEDDLWVLKFWELYGTINFIWNIKWESEKEKKLKLQLFREDIIPTISKCLSDIILLLDEQYKLNHDELTWLKSRRYLNIEFQKLFENAKENNIPLAVYFIDLDNFKRINDLHWHTNWDSVLKRSAWTIIKIIKWLIDEENETLNKKDVITFRYWWEELWIVLTNITEKQAIVIWHKINKEIKKIPLFSINKQVIQSASIWLSFYNPEKNEDIKNFGDILKDADDLMYKAKRWWRDRTENQIDNRKINCEFSDFKINPNEVNLELYEKELLARSKKIKEVFKIFHSTYDKENPNTLSGMWIYPEDTILIAEILIDVLNNHETVLKKMKNLCNEVFNLLKIDKDFNSLPNSDIKIIKDNNWKYSFTYDEEIFIAYHKYILAKKEK